MPKLSDYMTKLYRRMRYGSREEPLSYQNVVTNGDEVTIEFNRQTIISKPYAMPVIRSPFCIIDEEEDNQNDNNKRLSYQASTQDVDHHEINEVDPIPESDMKTQSTMAKICEKCAGLAIDQLC